MSNAAEQDEYVNTLREFILAAPPGELRSVLSALRVLVGDDDFFFETIPPLCLAHHMRHLTPFTLRAANVRRHTPKGRDPNAPTASPITTPTDATETTSRGDGEEEWVSFIVGRHNHVGTLVRRYAKAHALSPSATWREVETYFSQQHTHAVDPNPAATDPFADLLSPVTFETFGHIFFDPILGIFIEIDPVSESCIRFLPFSTSAPSPSMPPALVFMERQGGDTIGGVTNPIRQILQSNVRQYVLECFPPTSAESAAGSGVVILPHAHHDKDHFSIVIAISTRMVFPRNMWSGRWKSLFVMESDTELVRLRGETQVSAHYYEEGNIHLESARALPPVVLSEGKGNVWECSAEVMGHIIQHEQRLHEDVLRAARDVGDGALQRLRRRLPLTRQLFDFARRRNIPRPLATQPGYEEMEV